MIYYFTSAKRNNNVKGVRLMKTKNKGMLLRRVLSLVMIAALVLGLEGIGSALAKTGNDLVVKNSSGKVITKCTFVGGKDSGQIPKQVLTCVTSEKVSVLNYYDWINYYVEGNKITVWPNNNYTGESREGKLFIGTGSKTAAITISQRIFEPNVDAYGYFFGTPTVSKELINAYKPFTKTTDAHKIEKCEVFSLAWETCRVLKVSIPREFIVGTQEEIAQIVDEKKLGYPRSYYANVYGKYDADNDVMFVNLSYAKDSLTLAKAVIHELRHKWQFTYNFYYADRVQYLIRYNLENYKKGDAKQIIEVDAMGYADRVVKEIERKMK